MCGYGYGYDCSVPCSGYFYDNGYGYGYHYVNCDGYVGCNGYASCAGTVNSDGYVGCNVRQDGYNDESASAYVYCAFNGPYSVRCDAYVNSPGVGCDGYPGCMGAGCDGYQDCTGVGCDGYPDCTGTGCDGYTGGGVGGDGYEADRPDLVVNESHGPNVMTKGDMASLSWTVSNSGGGPAMPFPWMFWWNDGAYLSADMVLDSGDKLLANAPSPSYLAPGGSYSAAVSQYVFNINAGQYNLLVKSDILGVVSEVNEENNVHAGSLVTIGGSDPDLVMTAASAPAIIDKGVAFEIEARVENQGQGPGLVEPQSGQTTSVWYKYYLSSDAQWDNTTDYQLTQGSGLMPAGFSLAPASSIDAAKVVFTGNIPLGDYYLLAVADPGNGALESDEANNVTVVRQVRLNGPQPDLSQPWLDPVPDVIFIGDLVTLKWGVTNNGTAAAQGCTPADWIFLSGDAQLSYEDRVIASANAPSYLATGDAYWRERTWWVPPTLVGSYYIIAVSDVTHCVAEADETNNTSVIPIEVRPQPSANPQAPDLTVTALDAEEFVHAEATETIKWTVRNIGSTTVGSWHDAAYLSIDGTLDGGDALLGSKNHTGSLVSNQTYSTNMNAEIPAGTPEGDYKLILRADENAANSEYDYGNNILVKDIVVDNTPMVISDVDITPACGGAVVSWQTSEAIDSFIHWWDATGWHYKGKDGLRTSHSLTLTGFSVGKAASVQIVALDRARNIAEHDVDFIATIGMPGLSVTRSNVYWDGYAAYEQRLLTVDYLMTNNGDTEATGVAVDSTTDTNGVTLGVNMPVAVGQLAAGQSRPFSLKYYVPPNVSSFQSRLHGSARDACGTSFTYP